MEELLNEHIIIDTGDGLPKQGDYVEAYSPFVGGKLTFRIAHLIGNVRRSRRIVKRRSSGSESQETQEINANLVHCRSLPRGAKLHPCMVIRDA